MIREVTEIDNEEIVCQFVEIIRKLVVTPVIVLLSEQPGGTKQDHLG